jgi:hypothetical protein
VALLSQNAVHCGMSAGGHTRQKIRLSGLAEKRRYILDGRACSTLEEFAAHFSSVVLEDYQWRGNLDAFNDILRGGFGTPEQGFVLVWRDHALSKQRLGHAEMTRRLESLLQTCHPSNIPHFQVELADARAGQGPTLFDLLTEIIRDHGAGGTQAEDGVELILE